MKKLLLILLCLPIFGFGQLDSNKKPHKYGGWYCPDNLNGFPAVDIENWESVSVVNGRMATLEETLNGTSLIFIDNQKYPNAIPLEMKMPKLAKFNNIHSGKRELIIIIQALNISNDSIVGFRYLNGGNGSARLNEVTLLSDDEIKKIPLSQFVNFKIKIDAKSAKIWEVLTKDGYSKPLQAIFDEKNILETDWEKSSKVNFKYLKAGLITSEFSGNVWGNKYIQIDCELGDYQYVEKFMIQENQKTNTTEFQIVCGPYGDDFENQKTILKKWAQKVKEMSEFSFF